MKTEVTMRSIKDDEKKGQSIALNITLTGKSPEDLEIIDAVRSSPEGAMELGAVTVSHDKPEVEIELVF